MILKRVTITGADDGVHPDRLLKLSKRYPFVEWGILFSGNTFRRGSARFPSASWVASLADRARKAEIKPQLSAHLCGQYVRDIVDHGTMSWWSEYHASAPMFRRVQLNFHAETHQWTQRLQVYLNISEASQQQIILQVDGVNDAHCRRWVDLAGAVPLFDASHGAGQLPDRWPAAWPGVPLQGYAGGLSPENIYEQVTGPIADATAPRASQVIWVDLETHVRTRGVFDLAKAEAVLTALGPLIPKVV